MFEQIATDSVSGKARWWIYDQGRPNICGGRYVVHKLFKDARGHTRNVSAKRFHQLPAARRYADAWLTRFKPAPEIVKRPVPEWSVSTAEQHAAVFCSKA